MTMSSSSSPPSPPHQYPQAIQLKLYQAFIFSIPILFSIILFLLFYLFYLKRRASTLSLLPRTTNINDTTLQQQAVDTDLKNDQVKMKMCTILYDECMKARDSVCCVCLGEFEVKDELLQVASCKHMFHVDCISYWLHNHTTCPLCRAPALLVHIDPPPAPPIPTGTTFPSNLIHQQQQHCITILPSSQGSSSSASGSS